MGVQIYKRFSENRSSGRQILRFRTTMPHFPYPPASRLFPKRGGAGHAAQRRSPGEGERTTGGSEREGPQAARQRDACRQRPNAFEARPKSGGPQPPDTEERRPPGAEEDLRAKTGHASFEAWRPAATRRGAATTRHRGTTATRAEEGLRAKTGHASFEAWRPAATRRGGPLASAAPRPPLRRLRSDAGSAPVCACRRAGFVTTQAAPICDFSAAGSCLNEAECEYSICTCRRASFATTQAAPDGTYSRISRSGQTRRGEKRPRELQITGVGGATDPARPSRARRSRWARRRRRCSSEPSHRSTGRAAPGRAARGRPKIWRR